jgi:hypothetical protein
MAINWSKGAISLGGSFKERSAQLKKDEYMAAASAVTAQDSLMGRYKTVLDTIDTSIKNNRDTITGKIINDALDNDLQMGKAILIEAIMSGTALPTGSWNSILELSKSLNTTDATLESAGDDAEAASGFWSAMYADTIGQALPQGMSWIKEKMEDSFKGLSEEEIKKPETIIESAKKIPGAWEEILDWWRTTKFGSNPGIGDAIPQEEPSSPLDDVGMAGLISEGEGALAQSFSAEGISDPMSTAQAGIGMTEEELAQITAENARQQEATSAESEALNQYIGSEEALQSLSSIGGPVGEPAGKTTVKDFVIGKPKVEIEISSPEIEERKSTILSNVFSAIKGTESNVMGYNAVSDTTDGDRGLTTSTVKEVLDKHGNTAVGVGQFKYKEFMKPTAEKWFGMTEDQLKEQMFTPQFQDALLIAGIYDAGLQQFVDDKISVDVFQKRLANIWRGLPPTRETKEGDIVDEFENKARMSGEEFRSLLLQFNTMTEGLIGAGTLQEMGQ